MAAATSPFLYPHRTIAQFLSEESPPAVTTEKGPETDWDALHLWATGIFLTLKSYFLHLTGMTDLSKRVWVESRHILASSSELKTTQVFQKNLLAKSINTHRLDSDAYYLRPTEKTRLETSPVAGSLQFFHDRGMCRGMCHWFAHLYFKTLGKPGDREEHIKGVGRQFEIGAPRQAAFLNSLQLSPLYTYLGIENRPDHSKLTVQGKTQSELIAAIQLRFPGVYGIYTSTHQLLYLKVDEARQYLFDPNVGVIRIDSPALFETAMQPYFATHDPVKEIHIDLYTPR
jgi:hypothetical protein